MGIPSPAVLAYRGVARPARLLATWQMHEPWAPPTVAPEAGVESLPPLVSHLAYLITGRALPPLPLLARPLLCPFLIGQAPAVGRATPPPPRRAAYPLQHACGWLLCSHRASRPPPA